jgi:hypothetical protein
MVKHLSPWWAAGGAALILTAVAGVGAVMAQESPTPGATTTQETPEAQETPAADETPSAQETPDNAAPGGDHDGGEGRRGGCGIKGVDAEALAGFLGITADDLPTELQADGATLATVAAAHGQSRDALIDFLTSAKQAALAAEVVEGDLTEAEADEKLAEFTANIDEKIDASPAFGHGLRGGSEDDDGDGTSNGAQFRSRSRT